MNICNILELTKSKNALLRYAEKIKEKFDGPSAYFYLKVIKRVRSSGKDYIKLFEDKRFIEYLYATLCSWGIHRMDRNTRMADFDDFEKNINNQKSRFERLKNKDLVKDLYKCEGEIKNLFKELTVMKRAGAPKLVANSKIMHYLLPNLIPPIDKGNSVYFFYGERRWSKEKKQYLRYISSIRDEVEVFWEILGKFKEIAECLKLGVHDLKNKWDTSIPKLIGNAIIGWNIEEKKKYNTKKSKASGKSKGE